MQGPAGLRRILDFILTATNATEGPQNGADIVICGVFRCLSGCCGGG